MKNFFSFLKSKPFFIHTGTILVLIAIILFVTLKWLSSYTNHGEFVTVPDFKDQKVKDLEEFIKDKGISYQIIDSIYDPKEKPGIVLRQDPEAKVAVKHNRTVYLYVTGMVAPEIIMPKLVDRSERLARLVLNRLGLKVGRVTEKAADCNGCVLAQSINGIEVEHGVAIKKGSVVDLIVGTKDNFFHSGNSDSTSVNEEPDDQ